MRNQRIVSKSVWPAAGLASLAMLTLAAVESRPPSRPPSAAQPALVAPPLVRSGTTTVPVTEDEHQQVTSYLRDKDGLS